MRIAGAWRLVGAFSSLPCVLNLGDHDRSDRVIDPVIEDEIINQQVRDFATFDIGASEIRPEKGIGSEFSASVQQHTLPAL
jgi:hypothetical protein